MIGSVTWIFTFYLCASYALELTCMNIENTRTKQYRNDYVYSPKNDVFYKQHVELKEYEQARDLCNNEGAELMVPSSWHDVMQLDEIIKKKPNLEWMWIGTSIKEDQSTGNSPDEEQSNHNQHKALTRDATIVDVLKTNKLPFICKVKANDLPLNFQCNGTGYQYNATVRSCYRISKVTMTWYEANSKCKQEGAHLVILNSETEHQTVWNLIKNLNWHPGKLHYAAGFSRAEGSISSPLVFRTIFGKTLEEAGYSQWSEGEPNNLNPGPEYCGTIEQFNGKLNDIDCCHFIPYICEKEIH